MKHTKGKWITKNHRSASGDYQDIISENDLIIAHIIGGEHRDDIVSKEESENNAKLISKAPEMYEALKAISRDIYEWHEVKAKAYLKLVSLLKEIES